MNRLTDGSSTSFSFAEIDEDNSNSKIVETTTHFFQQQQKPIVNQSQECRSCEIEAPKFNQDRSQTALMVGSSVALISGISLLIYFSRKKNIRKNHDLRK